jgi:DNA-binding transcriptional LysR family regulator
MLDLHTRRLRYFVAVAEELHFTRAAARLYVAQQAISKQIRELEAELGVVLFRRNTRKVELTPAGENFLVTCREVLDRLDAGLAALRHGEGAQQRVLRLGFLTGAALELTAPIMEEFQNQYPDVDVRMREYPLSQPTAGLQDGTSDVAIIRKPFTLPGVETVRLFSEPVVVGVPRRHRLADRTHVTPPDLRNETITVGATADPAWRDYWTLGGSADPGRSNLIETTSQTEESELVAAGRACTVTAAAAARYLPHAGIVYIPLKDHPRSDAVVAWAPGPAEALARTFGRVAAEVRDARSDVVAFIENPNL